MMILLKKYQHSPSDSSVSLLAEKLLHDIHKK